VMMPGMSGHEVAARLKQDERTRNIPIIMVTALDDRESRLLALKAGAEEFLNKPVDRSELWVRVRNLLRLKEYQNSLATHNAMLEQQVAERTEQLADAYRETVYAMVSAAEYKDEDTGAHVQRISFYCLELAEQLGMTKDFCDTIFYASPMHDIGKIAIPDAVLLKPGSFTPQEWSVMKAHCALGAQILARGKSPYLQMGAEIALNHHERWDGGGYPNGIKGEDIPISARIMNICDQYDALRSKRPYKPALPHDKAFEIITVGDGRTMPGHFDPRVLAAFTAIAGRLHDVYESSIEDMS
jgi:putative two-component system response regulator